ncbi:11829_t:CDS:1, partial [Racocetra fulgida]
DSKPSYIYKVIYVDDFDGSRPDIDFKITQLKLIDGHADETAALTQCTSSTSARIWEIVLDFGDY